MSCEDVQGRLTTQAANLSQLMGELRAVSTRRGSAVTTATATAMTGMESVHTSPRRSRLESPSYHASELVGKAEAKVALLRGELTETKRKCVVQVQEAIDLVGSLQRRVQVEESLRRKIKVEQDIAAQRLAELQETQAKIETLSRENQALHTALKSHHREVDGLREQEALLQTEHSDTEHSLQAELSRVHANLKDARQREGNAVAEVQQLQQQLDDAQRHNAELRSAADARDRKRLADLTSLKARVECAEEELDLSRAAQQGHLDTEQRAGQLRAQLMTAEEGRMVAEEARAVAEAQYATADVARKAAEVAANTTRIALKEAETARCNAVQEAETARHNAQHEVETARHSAKQEVEMAVHSAKLEVETARHSAVQDRDGALREQLARAQEEVRLYRVEAVKKEAELERDRIQHGTLLADRDTIRKELPLLREALTLSHKELVSVKGAQSHLVQENAHMKQVVQRFRSWAMSVLGPEELLGMPHAESFNVLRRM